MDLRGSKKFHKYSKTEKLDTVKKSVNKTIEVTRREKSKLTKYLSRNLSEKSNKKSKNRIIMNEVNPIPTKIGSACTIVGKYFVEMFRL